MHTFQSEINHYYGKNQLNCSMKGICINNCLHTTTYCIKYKNCSTYQNCNMIINMKNLLQYISHTHDLGSGPYYIGHQSCHTADPADLRISPKKIIRNKMRHTEILESGKIRCQKISHNDTSEKSFSQP